MKRHDDYLTESHHFWTYFWCGLVFGALFGALIGAYSFDSVQPVIATAAIIAILFAYASGRWGDSAWEWIIKLLRQ